MANLLMLLNNHRRHYPIILVTLLLLVACGPANFTPTPIPPTARPSADILHVIPADSTIAFTAEALGGSLVVEGIYGTDSGSVTLTPDSNELWVNVYLVINTESVTVGNAVIDEALKLGMETGQYPTALFEAESTTLVPDTDDPIHFTLEGTLTLHGETNPVGMAVGPATVIDGHMHANATMDIDLADFGIQLPSAVVNSAITLNVILVADINANAPPPIENDAS